MTYMAKGTVKKKGMDWDVHTHLLSRSSPGERLLTKNRKKKRSTSRRKDWCLETAATHSNVRVHILYFEKWRDVPATQKYRQFPFCCISLINVQVCAPCTLGSWASAEKKNWKDKNNYENATSQWGLNQTWRKETDNNKKQRKKKKKINSNNFTVQWKRPSVENDSCFLKHIWDTTITITTVNMRVFVSVRACVRQHLEKTSHISHA